MDSHETAALHPPSPKLLVTIVDRSEGGRLESLLREKHVHFHYMFNAMGTANSETLKTFGLSGTEKEVCICIEPSLKINALMTAVTERMELTRAGNGVVFVIPISGISGAVSNAFSKELQEHKERWDQHMEQSAEKTLQEAAYEVVIAIINQGYSEKVMDAAHTAGARGGTILNARRANIEDAVKFFGISLQSEKEIVAIVIPKSKKKELMQAITMSCGVKSEAHGIVISLPVESCAGLNF